MGDEQRSIRPLYRLPNGDGIDPDDIIAVEMMKAGWPVEKCGSRVAARTVRGFHFIFDAESDEAATVLRDKILGDLDAIRAPAPVPSVAAPADGRAARLYRLPNGVMVEPDKVECVSYAGPFAYVNLEGDSYVRLFANDDLRRIEIVEKINADLALIRSGGWPADQGGGEQGDGWREKYDGLRAAITQIRDAYASKLNAATGRDYDIANACWDAMCQAVNESKRIARGVEP